jgi:hypothetical protein
VLRPHQRGSPISYRPADAKEDVAPQEMAKRADAFKGKQLRQASNYFPLPLGEGNIIYWSNRQSYGDDAVYVR